MKVLILDAICLYSVFACIWVVWEGLRVLHKAIVSLGALICILCITVLYNNFLYDAIGCKPWASMFSLLLCTFNHYTLP